MIQIIAGQRTTENRLRHYDRLGGFPDGVVALGDAVCAFNPVYAQGMTAAALGAEVLDRWLRQESSHRGPGRSVSSGPNTSCKQGRTCPWRRSPCTPASRTRASSPVTSSASLASRRGSSGRPQESPNSPQVPPRNRSASPLGFSQDRGASHPNFAGDDDRSGRPLPPAWDGVAEGHVRREHVALGAGSTRATARRTGVAGEPGQPVS